MGSKSLTFAVKVSWRRPLPPAAVARQQAYAGAPAVDGEELFVGRDGDVVDAFVLQQRVEYLQLFFRLELDDAPRCSHDEVPALFPCRE